MPESLLSQPTAKPPRKAAIFVRTLLFSWGVIVFALGLFALAILTLFRSTLEKNLMFQAEILSSSIAQVTIGSIVAEDYSTVVEHCLRVIKERPLVRFIVISRKDGFSILHNDKGWKQETLSGQWIPPHEQGPSSTFETTTFCPERVFRYSHPLECSGIDWGWIHLGLSTKAFESSRKEVLHTIGMLAALCVAFGFLFSLYFARKLTRPIQDLEETAKRIGAGDFSVRAAIHTGDELEALAESLHRMTQALEQGRDELIATRDNISNIVKSISDPLFVVFPNGIIQMVNPAACKTLGLREEELTGSFFETYFPPGALVISKIIPQKAPGQEILFNQSTNLLLKGKNSIPVLVSGAALYEKTGQFQGVVAIAKDIREQKKAEEILRWNLRVNRAVADLSELLIEAGASLEVISGLLLFESIELLECSEGFVVVQEGEKNFCAAGTPFFTRRESESERRHLSLSKDPSGAFSDIWGKALDDTEPVLLNSLQKLPHPFFPSQSNTHYSSFLSIPVVLGREVMGELVFVNASAGFRQEHIDALKRLVEPYGTFLHRLRSDKEKSHLENQLRQSQKMEAIGTLAGGIAHDFNNILAAMIGFAEIALEKLGPHDPEKVADDIREILTGGKRAADLVQQILTFSRRQDQTLKPLDFCTVAEDSLKLLRASLPSTISITRQIPGSALPILADLTQVQQIIMNLCTNAGHAMRVNGGVLTFSLSSVPAEEITANHPERDVSKSPLWVRLRVQDTGHGIEASILERIFDPFFTTKSLGEGTGMGLAIVHGITALYGGIVRVTSEVGKGTTFTLYFPQVPVETLVPALPEAPSVSPGTEHILLIDDEPNLIRLLQSRLSLLGYRVTAFTESLEALKEFLTHPDAFDLILSDQTMPGFSGAELAKQVKKTRPSIPIIIMTGFSEILTPEKVQELGLHALMSKPLDFLELSRHIRSAFDAPRSP